MSRGRRLRAQSAALAGVACLAGVLLALALAGSAPAANDASNGGGTPAGTDRSATPAGGARAPAKASAEAAQGGPEYETPTTPDYQTPTTPDSGGTGDEGGGGEEAEEDKDVEVPLDDREEGAEPAPPAAAPAGLPSTGLRVLMLGGAGLLLLGLGLSTKRVLARKR